MAKIWIYSKKASLLPELVAGAYELSGERPCIFVVNDEQAAQAAAGAGGDVCLLGEGGEMPEDYVETMAAHATREPCMGMLFGTTVTDRAIAGRLAAIWGVTAYADVKTICVADGAPETTHLVYGGSAILTNRSKGDRFIALVGPSIFEAGSFGEGKVEHQPFAVPSRRIHVAGTREKTVTAVNLAAAKKIVSVGLGLAKESDLALIQELVDLLGAELSCSRPVAEGLNWLPQERYVGISGAFVKPDVYWAIGISGQVQHTVGCTEAKNIVAINKDENCSFVKNSDYALVGDLYEVVPALIARLKEMKAN